MMKGQIQVLSGIIKEFTSCKAYIKKLFRKQPTTDLHLSTSTNVLAFSPMQKLPSVSSPPANSNKPPSGSSPPQNDKLQLDASFEQDTIPIQTNQKSPTALQAQVLVGSLNRGVYVPKSKVEAIKSEYPQKNTP